MLKLFSKSLAEFEAAASCRKAKKEGESMGKNTFELIYEEVKKIPRGKVATYGQIATNIGNRRWSQVVGFALHSNPDPKTIPCHRVVNRFGETSGSFAFGGGDRQRELLESEGVEFTLDGKVNMGKFMWDGLYKEE